LTSRSTPFEPKPAIQILSRTPAALGAMLGGHSASGIRDSGQVEDWSPYDVVGHLVHGEETDWIPRALQILREGESRAFDPFDRVAQFERQDRRSLDDLLASLMRLRQENLSILEQLHLGPREWKLRGSHPELGQVTLGQLIAAWAVHDLDHVAQIATAMAKQFSDAVGPWRAHLEVLER